MRLQIYKRGSHAGDNLSHAVKNRAANLKDDIVGHLSKERLTAVPDLPLVLACSSDMTRICWK